MCPELGVKMIRVHHVASFSTSCAFLLRSESPRMHPGFWVEGFQVSRRAGARTCQELDFRVLLNFSHVETCIYIHMYIYSYTHIHIHIHIYIHMQPQTASLRPCAWRRISSSARSCQLVRFTDGMMATLHDLLLPSSLIAP